MASDGSRGSNNFKTYLSLALEFHLLLMGLAESLVAALDLITVFNGGACSGIFAARVVRDVDVGAGDLRLRDLQMNTLLTNFSGRMTVIMYRGLVSADLAPTFSDEGVLGRGLVNPAKRILRRTRLLRNRLSTAGEEIATDDTKVAEKLTRLSVSENEGKESTEVLNGLLAIGLGLLTLDWEDLVRVLFGLVETDVTRMPDKVLKDLVRVLLAHERTEGVEDVSGVLDELLALGREVVGVGLEGVVGEVSENAVDLVVGWETRLLHCGEGAIETEFAVDVCLELLAVDWLGDGAGGGVVADILPSLRERHVDEVVTG